MIDINHDIKVNEKNLPLSILNSDEPDYIRLLCFFQNIQCHPNLKPEFGSITNSILYTDLLLESACKQLGINRALSSLIKKQFIFIEFIDEKSNKRRIRVPESVLEEAIVDYLKDKERIRNAKSKQPKKKALWQRVL